MYDIRFLAKIETQDSKNAVGVRNNWDFAEDRIKYWIKSPIIGDVFQD